MTLTSINDARDIIFNNIKESSLWEYINIEESSSRILDENIYSPIDLPAFDRSKMDGWAIRSEDTPGKFRITGYLQAGAVNESFKSTDGFSDNHQLEKSETYKIMTGAPVIKGADSVLQIEKCRVEGNYVFIDEIISGGNSIARKGEDVSSGQLLLAGGTKLNAHHISLIASSGFRRIRVKKKLKVSIIVTGNELLEPIFTNEDPLSIKNLNEGRIFNSNAWAFLALCDENGLDASYIGTAGDTMDEFTEKIHQCSSSDIIILSGGVSVGDHDLVQEGLKLIGAKELFYKVNSKPGKPLLVCKKEETLIFGFPGNPVSSMVGFREFLIPAVKKIYGQKDYLPMKIPAVFSGTYIKRGDREHFINISVFREGERLIAREVSSNSSGDTASFAASNAILRVSRNVINDGEIVEVELVGNF